MNVLGRQTKRVVMDTGVSPKTVLWRYVSLAKFVDLLKSESLYFPRGDQFQDRHEGAFTESIKNAIEASYKMNHIDFTYQEFKRRLREKVYISCWHGSQNDSMAMWKVFANTTESVAITTTVRQLADAIEAHKLKFSTAIYKVDYVKHWRDPELQINPYSRVFAHKHIAYEYEKEYRVIIDLYHEPDEPALPDGMRISIDKSILLRSVVLAPESQVWFRSVVEGLCEKYGCKVAVRRSRLSAIPL